MSDQVEVWMELEPAQALALAQFVKRVGWSEIRQNAVDDDEAYAMREALGFWQKLWGNLAMPRADELHPEAPKPKRRGRPPKAKAQALANYKADDPERLPRIAG